MDIYEALKNDHREIKIILEELTSLKEDDDYRYVLIEEIRNLLIPHSRAEESVFYNTLRAIDADKGLIFHSYQEHLEAEALLRTLQVMDRMNLNWKETAKKLQSVILHHVSEEEDEVFPAASLIFSKDEATAMGDAFLQLRPIIAKEGLLQSTLDMVVNMLPPRLADKLRQFGDHHFSK